MILVPLLRVEPLRVMPTSGPWIDDEVGHERSRACRTSARYEDERGRRVESPCSRCGADAEETEHRSLIGEAR